MPEPLHGFEEKPLGDHLSALRAKAGPGSAAGHATRQRILVIFLLTCNIPLNENTGRYQSI